MENKRSLFLGNVSAFKNISERELLFGGAFLLVHGLGSRVVVVVVAAAISRSLRVNMASRLARVNMQSARLA